MHRLIICNLIPLHSGHFKKGHSDKGHKAEKKGEEEEKKTKYFDEDGDEAHDEKKGKINPFHVILAHFHSL